MKKSLELMISVVEAQETTTTPPPKKKTIEKRAPQVNPPPHVNMFEIEDSDIEEETNPIILSCQINIHFTLDAMVSVTQAPIDPLEGVVDNDSLSDIHLLDIITTTTKTSSFPLCL